MPSCYGMGIIPLECEIAMHTAELEVPCALVNSLVNNILVYDWVDNKSTAEQLAMHLKELGYENKTIGIEMGYPETFGPGAYDTKSFLTLKKELPAANFKDVTHLILSHRMIKDPQEICYMKEVCKISTLG